MSKTEQLPMTPAEFSEAYTQYYQTENYDSPERSRHQLIERLLTGTEQLLRQREQSGDTTPLRILDMGAGKQILESELQRHTRFKRISNRVHIITLDIARLDKAQLLAQDVDHVTADGSNLPFANDTFDVVYSSMAIDFMPRNRTFREVKRVLKAGGKIFINFHHPDLIDIKWREQETILQGIRDAARQARQLQNHAQNSSKLDQRLRLVERQRESLQQNYQHNEQFFGQVFPALIFHSAQEISDYLRTHFSYAYLNIREYTNMGSNGWYALDMELDADQQQYAATS